ncbi:hypothetical protein BDW62DRAFT_203127 [Aspergillus aurantiobrunneus]
MGDQPDDSKDLRDIKFLQEVASKYSREQILEIIQDYADNPGNHGIPDDGHRHRHLTMLRGYIVRLWPGDDATGKNKGVDYAKDDCPQIIFRRRIPPREDEKRRFSPFRTNPQMNGGPYPRCSNLMTLLGLFLSQAKLAPGVTTAREYFLSLTAVYGIWCQKILPNNPRKTPHVYQCTWYYKPDTTQKVEGDQTDGGPDIRYFLGESLGGYEGFPEREGDKDLAKVKRQNRCWSKLLQVERYNILDDAVQFDSFSITGEGGSKKYFYGKSLEAWQFGNCGETYPFLAFTRDPQSSGAEVSGLAIDEDEVADKRTNGFIDPVRILAPCANCTAIIEKKFGWKIENFREKPRARARKKQEPCLDTVASAMS